MTMNLRRFLLALAVIPAFASAQMPQLAAPEILSDLQKLSVSGSVLYVAAHPDDENTRLLAYLAKEIKVRTGYLSLTRGDGGQNLIGNEQAELLGLIRTQELLAARRVDGAEQFFSRANDFGFSKTADETFQIWGKEQILADAVWVIRKFKPDVIITRFPEDSRAGHGHHAASAIIAREAFFAAADPKRFPEQLKYVSVWKAKRILWNTFNFGGNNTTSPDQLKIDVGLFNPLMGQSYGEIAAISRTNHKSQGFGSALQRGEAFEFFSPIAGEAAKTSIFDGIDLSIRQPAAAQLIAELQKEFNPFQPWLCISKLIALSKLMPNQPLINQLILACSGTYLDVTARENSYAVGNQIPVKIQVVKRSPDLGSHVSSAITLKNGKTDILKENIPLTMEDNVTAKAISQPYWLSQVHPIGQYVINNPENVGFPENPDVLSYPLKVTIGGHVIELSFPINFKFTDPAKGEKYQPLIIAPPVTATLSEKAYLFNNNLPKTISVQLKSFRNNSTGTVTARLPKGWKVNPEKVQFNLAKKGDQETVTLTITPSDESNSGTLQLEVDANGVVSDKAFRSISYDHIPNISIFPLAKAKVEKLDIKTSGKRIGYIDGAGDLVAESLKQIGYEVTTITPFQVINSDLSSFDAIVTGVRLYNVSEEIKLMQPKLLAYVEKGGTLLVQYNVNNGLKTADLGPYPFKLVNKRVTEEDAKVEFLAPSNLAFHYPNEITYKDFEGWIQERGLYFANEIDQRYTPLLKMNDKGESPSDGALLVADYGKGKYVYTSLAFFRELPAGVAGAYRLFANLLARKPSSK